MNLSSIRKLTNKYLADYRHAKRCVKEEEETLTTIEQDVTNALEAQQILQGLAETIQNQAHQRIASVVSRCLEAVFEEPYEFAIRFKSARGKTEANLVFVRDGQEIDPVEASGGGVVDVAGFALRLACLTLSMPRKRRLLVLDEPMKFLSRDHTPKIRQLLEVLSKEMQVQIVMVTHQPTLQLGRVVEL